MTTLMDDIMKELWEDPKGSTSIIDEQSTDHYTNIIQSRFPRNKFRGVIWSKIPGYQSIPATQELDGFTNRDEEMKYYGEDIRRFWRMQVQRVGYDRDDDVVVVGDGVDKAIRMKAGVLDDCIEIVFSFTQSVFVIPPDASWLFLYTFGSDLYFGEACTPLP